MGYLSELAEHRRAIISASAGMGAGYLINHYVGNLFSPHLIEEFGWSRSDFALIGTLGLLTVVIVPIVGRLTDLIGVKLIALVGVISFPLTFVAYSLTSGSIVYFAAVTVLQTLLAGVTTSSLVYSRLIAERFVTARGLALGIMATVPSLVGVMGSPLLNGVIENAGWRMGYLVVACYTAIVGMIAIAIMPGRFAQPGSRAHPQKHRRPAREDYGEIFRTNTFWIIAGAFLLCNLIYPLQSTQMKLMLEEAGSSSSVAAWMISLLAAGVLIGRFLCGLALDRFPTHLVAAVALGMPSVGLIAVASGLTSVPILAVSVALMGLSLGSESDLAAYLVMRYFRLEIYGSALGLIVSALALSAALGSVVLSITLGIVDHFSLYMFIVGAASFSGGCLLLLLGTVGKVPDGERDGWPG